MRTKTNAKRQDILEAARIEFSQKGYHETTIDDVVRRIGTSKATIYNYFPNKEAMFAEMLADAAKPATSALAQILAADDPIKIRIQNYAHKYLEMQTSEMSIAIQRLLIGDADKLRATALALHNDPEVNGYDQLVKALEREQTAGNFRPVAPDRMARHLIALLYGNLVTRLLLCERVSFSDVETHAAAVEAVDTFFAAFCKS